MAQKKGMKNLDRTIITRLVYIKYLFNVAVEQSNRPDPYCGLSVLLFHDAVELFMHLACIHIGIDTKNLRFMEYWNLINKELLTKKKRLSHSETLDSLNSSRVSFKHHGRFPNRIDIDKYKSGILDFLEDSVLLIFGIKYDNLQLVDLIQSEQVRNLLNEANDHYLKDETEQAFENLALAFTFLIDDYQERKQIRGSSPFKVVKKGKYSQNIRKS
jgi:hypothetical protein